jgi:hypothetical protein
VKGAAIVTAFLLTGLFANSAHADDNLKELEEIEARCAKDIALATWDILRNLSWTELAGLLSASGVNETASKLLSTIQSELRGCFAEVYRVGVEDGEHAAKSQEAAD